MRYSEDFKAKVINDFKTCPYYKTICKKYGIERGTIKSWVRKANLDVEKLVEKLQSKETIDVLKFKVIKLID